MLKYSWVTYIIYHQIKYSKSTQKHKTEFSFIYLTVYIQVIKFTFNKFSKKKSKYSVMHIEEKNIRTFRIVSKLHKIPMNVVGGYQIGWFLIYSG